MYYQPGKIVLTIIALLLFASCGRDSRLNPLNEQAVILAFGDSLTFGKGVRSMNSYPSVLATLTHRKVVNAGVSGEISDAGLGRLPQVLKDTSPSILILMHGGNDILQNRSMSNLENNLRQMIKLALQSHVQVILIGIPEKKLFSSTAPAYKTLAEEFDLVFEDEIISSLLKKPSMKSDSVHFNQAGYGAIAEKIEKLLSENGAL